MLHGFKNQNNIKMHFLNLSNESRDILVAIRTFKAQTWASNTIYPNTKS
jgi:hypothetical protein